ncbi:hypothetical protein Tco_0702111 [Tanacetum coccineum]|uniref:Uncharacterized protein n=1 Tax=Tanacetum coccineum TaxID=301880 RepID=A0ABQ4XV23_9ASTR
MIYDMCTDLLYFSDMAHLPAADQRHLWPVNWVHVLDFAGLTPEMRQDLALRLRMVFTGEGQQLGRARMRITWRQLILALGLHTKQEMAEAGFGAY